MKRTGIGLLLGILASTLGCKGGEEPCEGAACEDAATDAPMDAPNDVEEAGTTCEGPPGLYADDQCDILVAGTTPYQPKYWLWSDGLDKQRFLFIPGTAQIDTSNPDRWVFPIGTRVYKHFILGDKILETRLIERVDIASSDDGVGFRYRTFRWNHAQTAVTELTEGEEDVLGTDHDIPSRAECIVCHSNGSDQTPGILSVGAIQLNHSLPGVTLTSLANADRLTHPISAETAAIPGNATEQAALGYLHANCGNCHRPGGNGAGIRLWAPVGQTTVGTMPAYETGVDVCTSGWEGGAVHRIQPNVPSESAIWLRMGVRPVPPAVIDTDQMPPLATEVVDMTGRATIAAWITAMPATAHTCPD